MKPELLSFLLEKKTAKREGESGSRRQPLARKQDRISSIFNFVRSITVVVGVFYSLLLVSFSFLFKAKISGTFRSIPIVHENRLTLRIGCLSAVCDSSERPPP